MPLVWREAMSDALADLRQGDCVEVMAAMEPDSIDAIVTDPPYGLEFMGKEWDKLGLWTTRDKSQDLTGKTSSPFLAAGVNRYQAGQAAEDWHRRWAEAAYRVLKPGGHMLAFGGTRTSHRLACAIEDAGFEIRDTLQWNFGSGFPKGVNVSKMIDKKDGRVGWPSPNHGKYGGSGHGAPTRPGNIIRLPNIDVILESDEARRWEGWGTALKPSHEPIILARKPLSERNVAANVLKHGTGAINVDGCRVATGDIVRSSHNITIGGNGIYGGGKAATTGAMPGAGRWPPNLLLSHSPDCERVGERRVKGAGAGWNGLGEDEARQIYGKGWNPDGINRQNADGLETVADWRCAEGCAVAELGRQSGVGQSIPHIHNHRRDTAIYGGGKGLGIRSDASLFDDTGTAARYFPQFGYEAADFWPFKYVAKASRAERNNGVLNPGPRRKRNDTTGGKYAEAPNPPDSNYHPTVKPLALMRWLLTLVVPPGGLALDPFAGSGSTLVAAKMLGVRCVGIEQDAGYCEIARQRIAATQAALL